MKNWPLRRSQSVACDALDPLQFDALEDDAKPRESPGVFICPHKSLVFPLVFILAACQYVVMVCIYCSGETAVTNSRHQKRQNHVWRRRRCERCQAVFTTIEGIDMPSALRVHKNQAYEPFLRDKLLLSVYESLRHRQTAIEDAAALTATILSHLSAQIQDATLVPETITEVTAIVLDRFDKAAATHYRAFHPPPK